MDVLAKIWAALLDKFKVSNPKTFALVVTILTGVFALLKHLHEILPSYGIVISPETEKLLVAAIAFIGTIIGTKTFTKLETKVGAAYAANPTGLSVKSLEDFLLKLLAQFKMKNPLIHLVIGSILVLLVTYGEMFSSVVPALGAAMPYIAWALALFLGSETKQYL